MPNRPVTIRRWEVAAAFVLLAASYIGGLWALTEQAHRTSHLVHENVARINDLHRIARTSCLSRHRLSYIAQRRTSLSIEATGALLRTSPAARDPATRRVLRHTIFEDRALLLLARRADCRLRGGLPTPPG